MANQILYVLTLEKLEKRYTTQWHSYWKKEFSKHYEVVYVDGSEQSDTIESGRFLDINMTNVWKAEQIKKVALLFHQKKIKDSDVFIFMDAWHPGVTAIKYMIQLNNIHCKMYGYWHAGTYDEFDFTAQAGLARWAQYDEVAWFLALDGSFVATQFHKNLILKKYGKYKIGSKIHVVGFPMDWEQCVIDECGYLPQPTKENIVVFPHRLDVEKQPKVFDLLSNGMKQRFVKTMEVTKTKKEYYHILSRSKVVFSANQQETYGIGTVEGIILWNIPLVPNRLSYTEMYDDVFRYKNIKMVKRKINYFTYYYEKNSKIWGQLAANRTRIINQSLEAIPKMVKIMKGAK